MMVPGNLGTSGFREHQVNYLVRNALVSARTCMGQKELKLRPQLGRKPADPATAISSAS
jgi:hypothetical protein